MLGAQTYWRVYGGNSWQLFFFLKIEVVGEDKSREKVKMKL